MALNSACLLNAHQDLRIIWYLSSLINVSLRGPSQQLIDVSWSEYPMLHISEWQWIWKPESPLNSDGGRQLENWKGTNNSTHSEIFEDRFNLYSNATNDICTWFVYDIIIRTNSLPHPQVGSLSPHIMKQWFYFYMDRGMLWSHLKSKNNIKFLLLLHQLLCKQHPNLFQKFGESTAIQKEVQQRRKLLLTPQFLNWIQTNNSLERK